MSSPTDESKPLVSVVVPFYNSEQYIQACIESLLKQRGLDGEYEILFIDNGSSDGSAAIVARYPEIISLAESRPGAYAARNTGLRRARAPVIAFTDADCAVDPDWLRSILEGMRDESVGAMVGYFRYPDEASWRLKLLGAYENAKAEYVVNRCVPKHHYAYANNMAVRASVFTELGLFQEWKRAGDSELIHRMARQRPDLRAVYSGSMRVTHLEFELGRKRARRLLLYARTNAQIETFRELGPVQRMQVFWRLMRGKGRL